MNVGARCFTAILLLLGVHASSPAAEGQAIKHLAFQLERAEGKNPYSLQYPIMVTEPGKIRVYVDGWGNALKDVKGKPIRIWLLDARGIGSGSIDVKHPTIDRKWVLEEQFLEAGGTKGNALQRGVDQVELGLSKGNYIVMLSNVSDNRSFRGEILIAYPGTRWELDKEVEEQQQKKPDLLVKSISLDKANHPVIEIANEGEGSILDGKWHLEREQPVMLSVKLQAKEVKIPLSQFDPEQKLKHPGKSLRYVLQETVTEETTVIARIDAEDQLLETNERNNRETARVSPTSH